MGNTSKSLASILILIMAISSLSLLLVKPAFGQPIPKPSVPQFTLQFVDKSYDVPSTVFSTTDPYSGKTTNTTYSGHHVKNYTMEVTIKNQLFPATIDGNKSNLYYNIRLKGHFGEDWNYQYPSFPTSTFPSDVSLSGDYSNTLPAQSSAQYTLFSFPASYRNGDEVDVQIEAVLGTQLSYNTYFYGQEPHTIPLHVDTFIYQSSNWSSTQTFTMPDTSLSNSPTPSVQEFSFMMSLPLFIFALSIAIMVKLRKTWRTTQY